MNDRIIGSSRRAVLSAGFAGEERTANSLVRSEDAQKGCEAMIEKRTPEYKINIIKGESL